MQRSVIRRITFNNGQVLDLDESSVVVFVGPNNVGKSQALRDIFKLLECSGREETTVVKSIDVERPSLSELREYLNTVSDEVMQSLSIYYVGMGIKIPEFALKNYEEKGFNNGIREAFYAFLDTATRLTICNPPKKIDRDARPDHPIHYIEHDKALGKRVSKSFKRAFGTDVTPHYEKGETTPLCLGDELVVPSISDAYDLIAWINETLNTYPQAHQQGDGIKNFLGILLYLAIDYFSGLFIDEPESFLHPPQAEIMGEEIGESVKYSRQVFLSTHSRDLLNGLISSCPEHLKIVRITRDGQVNTFSVLSNEKVKALSSTTLLKYSDTASALFHSKTILCEGDGDCRLYAAMLDHVREEENLSKADALFLPVGGKQRFKEYVLLLKELSIECTVVADIDLISSESELRSLFEACGGDWQAIKRDWLTLNEVVNSEDAKIDPALLKATIASLLNECTGDDVPNKVLQEISRSTKRKNKKAELKQYGKGMFSGEALIAYESLDRQLRERGIFLVPVGEIERFVSHVEGHGPSWVSEVFDKYQDLSSPEYDALRCFVKTWAI